MRPTADGVRERAERVCYDRRMKESDPHLFRWALDRRQERQATNSYEAFASGMGSPEPLEGWGGMSLRSSDNALGARELELQLRPVLLGDVEVRVQLTTEGPGSARPHLKRAYLYASPSALRDLAHQLLESADAADKLKLKPRPVP